VFITPEKALAILDGKIPRTEHSRRSLEEKKTPPPVSPKIKTEHWGITIGILALMVVTALYLWKRDTSMDSLYKKGFNDGASSMAVDLGLAQKEINAYIEHINQLQQEIAAAQAPLQQQIDQLRLQLTAAHNKPAAVCPPQINNGNMCRS
jgi:hypothetical protein